jgi:hypothetical protein
MSHFANDGREIHIVHSWRDGSYTYNNEYSADLKRPGAVAVGEDNALSKVVEFRHIKGRGTGDLGELFEWEKDENGEWVSRHHGEYSERFLVENDFTI